MIEANNLAKRFGEVEALRGVSLTAKDGRITGLLGPNGAGKSTCLRILSTVFVPDSGTATIGGLNTQKDPLAVRRSLGVLPHGSGLYPNLTAAENIRYYGELQGMTAAAINKRIEMLVAKLDMHAILDRRAKGFSQGERTKVALARALVHDPQHVLLDEPTSGLDVMAARQLRDWLRDLAKQGRCVLLSSHVMQEIEALVDELVIIANGQVVAAGTPDALKQEYANSNLEDIFLSAVSRA